MSSRPPPIYVGFPLDTAAREELEFLLPEERFWFETTKEPTADDDRAWERAEIGLGLFSATRLRQAPALRWLQFPSVGIEDATRIDWTEFEARLVCTNLRGVYSEPMAQTVLAGLLALCRGIDRLTQHQRERRWQRDAYHGNLRLLEGRVVLLGHGSVNRRVEQLLFGFGCVCTVYSRTGGDIRSRHALDQALPSADIVVAALPETPETRGLLNRRRIEALKSGALLANVGRGSLIEEEALVDALHQNRLGGALLDVTREEPLPPSSPLWDCPRLILTQHTSAGSVAVLLNLVRFFAENVRRFRRGRTLINRINWRRGY